MSKAVKTLNEKSFDFDKFREDMTQSCKERGMSMTRLSTDVVFRSESYLSGVLYTKSIPWKVAEAVVKWMGRDMKDYEIKKAPAKKATPKAEESKPVEVKEEASEKEGWTCLLKVDEEFGMAMMKIFKDGKEVALGRSYTYGHDDLGIVQGISYAAHMCYKAFQQEHMARESIMAEQPPVEPVPEPQAVEPVVEEPEEDETPVGPGRVVFKDWIRKYEKDNSKAGKLARFVKSNYQKIPATGKKKIRMYLRLNGGEPHLQVFDGLWSMYTKWYELQYETSNLRMNMVV